MNVPDDCGCCAGQTTETPGSKVNRPGLDALSYRVGTYATFRASLLARLSSTDYPALAALTTRKNDDWTIGLLDSFAVMGDVLTFYQERLANETFLRSAVEYRSVLELARLVGYRPAPGVAASTSLAFTLDTPLIQPAPPPLPVTIPVGTRVQSVPAAEEQPQTFETAAAIVARAEWNGMPVQTAQRELPFVGQTTLWLQGTSTRLQPGDALVLVGAARAQNATSSAWNLRFLTQVIVDDTRNVTCVRWRDPLTMFSPRGADNTDGVRIYALRQRAALFGHNAPDPTVVVAALPSLYKIALTDENSTTHVLTWKSYPAHPSQPIDLDAVYPKLAVDSWVALVGGGHQQLYGVNAVTEVSRIAFGLSAKVSRLTLDTTTNLNQFDLPGTSVFGQSDELSVADRPLRYPLFGREISLASVQSLLTPQQGLAFAGRRQRVEVPEDPSGVTFPHDAARVALPGESFIVAAPPVAVVGSDTEAILPEDLDPDLRFIGHLRWTLLDRNGATVTVNADAGVLKLRAAHVDDPVVEEIAAIDRERDALSHDRNRTIVRLKDGLANCYDRSTVRINANVAPATHGESVGEIAGSGDAAAANQRFQLRQSPLTYVPASNPQGCVSALTVRINDLQWTEAPTLYDQPATARVFALRQDDQAHTIVQFGDGIEGARLPSGTDNVRMNYRKGLGVAGNVRGGTITTLMSRPLGVKSATNPEPATGGANPATLAETRRNAPVTVLTLDRAVSMSDYADFARSFAGIAKSAAIWIGGGVARGVHLTVAGIGGAAVGPGSTTHQRLLAALRAYGDALLPLTLQSYGSATFELEARIKVDPLYVAEDVLAKVESALRTAFGFEARDFGQPVTFDEVLAVIHGVPGVVAVDINRLQRSGVAPNPRPEPRLFPAPALIQPDGNVSPAELLTLAADGLALSQMS